MPEKKNSKIPFQLHVNFIFWDIGHLVAGYRGVLLGIIGGGVPPDYPNPGPISD